MLYPFLVQAAQSPGRQQAFRQAVMVHLAILAGGVWMMTGGPPVVLGMMLLVAGIVEGAGLVGWRLTQLPKSRALEFLLVTPLRPGRVLFAETLVGLVRLGLVTLSGLPVLALLAALGRLDPLDTAVLLVMPFTWGAVTGLGLTVWAYEPLGVRRWGERILIGLVIIQLGIGILAGEHLRGWITQLPASVADSVFFGFRAFHKYNPFAVLKYWLKEEPATAWKRAIGLEAAALTGIVILMIRAAWRSQGHFHDLHYQPAVDRSARRRSRLADRPLSWWAVRRVSRYSGRINLWLAGGFGLLYALYTVAGPSWPAWLGRQIFQICDRTGGLPGLATALVVLAAVPAAFQYGLWDANAHERCRRLELLLLTGLRGHDYWEAAAAAAWRRGRGYFAVAVTLWLAAALAGQATWMQTLAAVAAGALLWALYFAVGFRAFTRGFRANGVGLLLTVGLPHLAYGLYQTNQPLLAVLMPPGFVHAAGAGVPDVVWLVGPMLAGVVTLLVARVALARCDLDLRAWYERHHGRKVIG
jgi:hypothetical protein